MIRTTLETETDILKAIAPKDLTPEQRDRIRRGEDPFRQRPREH